MEFLVVQIFGYPGIIRGYADESEYGFHFVCDLATELLRAHFPADAVDSIYR